MFNQVKESFYLGFLNSVFYPPVFSIYRMQMEVIKIKFLYKNT